MFQELRFHRNKGITTELTNELIFLHYNKNILRELQIIKKFLENQ